LFSKFVDCEDGKTFVKGKFVIE